MRANKRDPDGGKEKRDSENDERDEQYLLASLYRHKASLQTACGPGGLLLYTLNVPPVLVQHQVRHLAFFLNEFYLRIHNFKEEHGF